MDVEPGDVHGVVRSLKFEVGSLVELNALCRRS